MSYSLIWFILPRCGEELRFEVESKALQDSLYQNVWLGLSKTVMERTREWLWVKLESTGSKATKHTLKNTLTRLLSFWRI